MKSNLEQYDNWGEVLEWLGKRLEGEGKQSSDEGKQDDDQVVSRTK